MRQGRKNSGPASDAERELVAEGRSFEAVDPRIVRFIGRHRVLTLGTDYAEGALGGCNLCYANLPQA